MTQRLERREQTILFLNRRGYSTSLLCPNAVMSRVPELFRCPSRSIAGGEIALSHLRPSAEVPRVCPDAKCRNPEIRYSGLGTEKVEDTLTKVISPRHITRMDSDTLKRKNDYRRILGDFRAGKIDFSSARK
jgi:primosomal protein N' (replication factor Y)